MDVRWSPLALLALALFACVDAPKPDPDSGGQDLDTAPDTGADTDTDTLGCDDSDPSVHPGADELCNGRDDNCDGVIDEDAIDAIERYADDDGDGHGGAAVRACPDAAGLVDRAGDCADDDPGVHPEAAELCDGVDQDCDGLVDEDATDAVAWYADADGDAYGDPDSVTVACEAPAGAVDNAEDCDDAEPLAWTGATEVCDDGVDNDCDGTALRCGLDGRYVAEDGNWHYTGHQLGQFFGTGLAAVGDWTGDGVPEVLVGATHARTGSGYPGAVYLFEGGTSGSSASPLASYLGRGVVDQGIGTDVDLLGDLDADGEPEVLVGASGSYDYWEYTGQPGLTYVLEGSSGGTLDTFARLWGVAGDFLTGSANRAIGDMDLDGVDDLAIGATVMGHASASYHGGVYFVSGAALGAGGDFRLGTDLGTTLRGDPGSFAGVDLAGGPDTDGDGVPDVLVGSHGYATTAAWLVTRWPTADGDLDTEAGMRVLTDATDDFEGLSVALPGDMNGDGYGEVVVGALWDGADDAGAVYVLGGDLSGDVALSDAWLVLTGEAAGAHASSSLDRLGDFDGDGLDDLLVGSRSFDGMNGAVYAVTGAPTGTVSLATARVSWVGSTGDGVGQEVRGAGDLDGDGTPDVILAAPYSYTTHGSGEAWVWLTGVE